MGNLVTGMQRVRIGAAIPFPQVWQLLLAEWGAVLDRYMVEGQDMNAWVRQEGGDLPYWHEKEVTNLSFFAAAVWKLGGVALQEYEVTRPTSKGTADLWFKLQGLSCQVEAKGADSSSIQPEPFMNALNQARSQLIIPPSERADMGLALCFAVPATPTSNYDFASLTGHFSGTLQLSAVYAPSKPMNYQGFFYPGIAIIGEAAWVTAA